MNMSAVTISPLSLPLDEQYHLMEVPFSARMEEIGTLRIRAWLDEPGIDPVFFANRLWVDPIDQTAQHWVVTWRDVVVAAARMSYHDTIDTIPYADLIPDSYRSRYARKRIASINRLVVDPLFRGQGLSKLLDQARLAMAARREVEVVVAQPQLRRIDMLKWLGFVYQCELSPTPHLPGRPLFFMHLDL